MIMIKTKFISALPAAARYFVYTFAVCASVAGCQRDKGNFDNKMFIDAENLRNEVRVAVDENVESVTKTIAVSVAQPLSEDIEIRFINSPELLNTYREAYYDKEAELLPAEHYDLSELKGVIKAGNVSTGDISLKFNKLREGQGLDYSKRYVLPVSIEAEGIDALARAKTMYFVVRKAALVNVVAEMQSNCAWPEWGAFDKVENMENFTLECLLLGHAFDNKSQVHTIMGVEDHFLIRSGDAGLAGNQIQIAWAYKNEEQKTFRGNITAANMQLKADQWYHLAVTFEGGEKHPDGGIIKIYLNGKLRQQGICKAADDSQKEVPIKAINFKVPHSDESDGKPRCFWIGYSYDKDRSFNGMMSEVRVWNKALTEEEINSESHFYKLYPDADSQLFPDSLVAYWKFNEGKGSKIKDWSGNNNDLTADHDFVWYPVDLPIK